MASKREERERRRRERLAAEQAAAGSERRRMFLGYAVAGLIVAAIVVGIVIAVTGGGDGDSADGSGEYPELAYVQPELGVVPDGIELDGREGIPPPEPQNAVLEESAAAAGCDLRLDLKDEGSAHFTDEDTLVDYETSPPTSGDHYGDPAEVLSGALADGAYLETPPITRAVHSLEHGRVEIQYSPDLPEREQLEIKGVFEESPEGVLLFPNPDMTYDVAITAWRDLAGCEAYEGAATLDLLRAFRDTFRGDGPEDIPLSVAP